MWNFDVELMVNRQRCVHWELCTSFDIILQNTIQISELVDKPIANTFLTVRKEFPVYRG